MKTKEFEFRSFQADMWWLSRGIPDGYNVALAWDTGKRFSWFRKILNKLGA